MGDAAEPGSVLDGLRQRHRRIKKKKDPLELDVPGYDGNLVAKFRPLSFTETATYREVDTASEELDVDADLLIAACEGVFVRQDGELEPIDPDAAAPVKIGDKRLAQLLAEPDEELPESARDVVFWLFPDDHAVDACANALIIWSKTLDRAAAEELEGKSEGGTTSS